MGANAHLTMPLLASSSQRFVTGGENVPFPLSRRCKGSGDKDGGEGCSCSPLGPRPSAHHEYGLARLMEPWTYLYLHVAWSLSVHVIDDGEVPIEEGVCTRWA